MTSLFSYKTILIIGALEAILNALGSPMTQGVFLPWVRCLAFALGVGFAAIMKLMVVLSKTKAGEPLDPAVGCKL